MVLGDKKHKCEVCSKKFIHSYTLTAHRRVHTGEKPFICSTCGNCFTTSSQLTLHTRTHTREKPYLCSVCPKVSSETLKISNCMYNFFLNMQSYSPPPL